MFTLCTKWFRCDFYTTTYVNFFFKISNFKVLLIVQQQCSTISYVLELIVPLKQICRHFFIALQNFKSRTNFPLCTKFEFITTPLSKDESHTKCHRGTILSYFCIFVAQIFLRSNFYNFFLSHPSNSQ